MPYALCLMPYAPCLMPYAPCLMPYALCPMPYALCPMPDALCLMPYALCPTPIQYNITSRNQMILHLIDGTYELFRHFYGLRSFNKGKDKPMGAVAGVLNGVLQ